jgi:GGDEF domain-containing protein/CHASE3 domain sensor protein
LTRLSVSQKIAVGYLLVVVFCLAALIYALLALNSLTRRSEQVIGHEFKALVLARDLSRTLLDQERLERQILVLRDPAMLPLLDKRQEESATIWKQFSQIPILDDYAYVEKTVTRFDKANSENRFLLMDQKWDQAEKQSMENVAPERDRLLRMLQLFRLRQEGLMNETLQDFSLESNQAYRLTLALTFSGVGLAALVATGIILTIRRSIARLTRATKAVAEGSFDHSIGLEGRDEFGRLARDFAEMAKKLQELQTLHLDANPLTRLPGNLAIARELESRITSGRPFAHIYIDLDYFKAYNDRYGYRAGSDVISKVGVLVQEVAARCGNQEDLVGHIGGDDYVILSTPDRAETVSTELIREFDAIVPGLYSEQDREAGFFKGEDRYGVERLFPLLSMSIAVVCSNNLRNPSAEVIGLECAKMKEHLKKLPGSNFLIDRRVRR